MLDAGNKPVTIEEAQGLVNKLRESVGIRPLKRDGVYEILYRYSEFYEERKKARKGYLLIVGKRKVPGICKPLRTYKLSASLVKRMDTYTRRWVAGMTINTKVKRGKKVNLHNLEYGTRARSIMFRMMRGEVDFYDFMLVREKVNLVTCSTSSHIST
ncbi:MAG: hypothetical protein A4E23_00179 [Methanomethylovorans sp. PtaU1.Bin073]|jgi:hypothetical protein|nr:MAG: hypothetical protein A4E23_00179 [Methanomethylovorans sp. PtaU1.Bin073]